MYMLNHRLAFTRIVAMLFIAIYTISGLMIATPASAHSGEDASRLSLSIQQQEQPSLFNPTSACPDVPASNKPFLDFCSPKDHGDVAAPYGAHIIMASGNLTGKPDKWVIAENPISNAIALGQCIVQATCFALSNVKSLGEQNGQQIYSFTWSGSNFPTQTGNYFVEVLVGQSVVATPLGFSLLTSAAPCITLAEAATQPPSCSPGTQSSVSLTSIQATNLLISGTNWLLGWRNKPSNEKVEVTATCVQPDSCSQNPLFTTKADVDGDGSFSTSVPIPANVYGNYEVTAVNHVQTQVNPGDSDYSQKSDNSVADGTLTFGTSLDSGQMVVNVSTQPLSHPTPVAPTLPASTTIPANSFSEKNVSMYAFISFIPAMLGLIIFFAILFFSRSTTNPARPSPFKAKEFKLIASQLPPLLKIDLAYINAATADAEDLLAKEKLVKVHTNAMKRWKQYGTLRLVEHLAEKLLYQNNKEWISLRDNLRKTRPPEHIFLPGNVRKMYNRAYQTIQDAAFAGKEQLFSLYSKALVQHTALSSLPCDEPLQQAVVSYNMGLAYTILASHTPFTTVDLLKEAKICYESARDSLNNVEGPDIYRFQVIVLVSIGDIDVVLAQLLRATVGKSIQVYLSEACDVYEQAESVETGSMWRQEIQKRLDSAGQLLVSSRQKFK